MQTKSVLMSNRASLIHMKNQQKGKALLNGKCGKCGVMNANVECLSCSEDTMIGMTGTRAQKKLL